MSDALAVGVVMSAARAAWRRTRRPTAGAASLFAIAGVAAALAQLAVPQLPKSACLLELLRVITPETISQPAGGPDVAGQCAPKASRPRELLRD